MKVKNSYINVLCWSLGINLLLSGCGAVDIAQQSIEDTMHTKRVQSLEKSSLQNLYSDDEYSIYWDRQTDNIIYYFSWTGGRDIVPLKSLTRKQVEKLRTLGFKPTLLDE